MQVAVKTMPLNSLIVGVDLDPIRPIKGAQSIVGDITTSKARMVSAPSSLLLNRVASCHYNVSRLGFKLLGTAPRT